jgi:hypothetical protein
MAMNIFSTPATEVEGERIISIAQQVYQFYHNCLDAHKFKQVMVVQRNDKPLKVYNNEDKVG